MSEDNQDTLSWIVEGAVVKAAETVWPIAYRSALAAAATEAETLRAGLADRIRELPVPPVPRLDVHTEVQVVTSVTEAGRGS